MNLLIMMSMSMIMTSILFAASKHTLKKQMYSKEKSSNFECGFESQTSKNNFISGQFFMIAMLFIIFDMEITLIIPILQNSIQSTTMMWNLMVIIILLIAGTILEWKMGLVEWAK